MSGISHSKQLQTNPRKFLILNILMIFLLIGSIVFIKNRSVQQTLVGTNSTGKKDASTAIQFLNGGTYLFEYLENGYIQFLNEFNKNY